MHAPAGKKRLRPRPWPLLALGLVLAGAVFALPQVINLSLGQQKLKEYAELSLSQAFGRKVTVGGEARLTSLPWMSLRVADLAVDDAPGFGPEPFLSVGLVTVDIRILPLFTRTIMPGAVTLASPVLRLKRDASDRGNWQDLPFLALQSRGGPALASPDNGDDPHREEAPPGWNVAPLPSGIRIQDATVHFEDRRRGWSGALRHFTLSTGRGERFDFHLSFEVTGLDPAVEAHIQAKGTAGFDADRQSLSLEGALVESTLSVPGEGRSAAGSAAWGLTLRALVDFDSALGHLAVRDLAASSEEAELDGRLDIRNLMDRPEATAALSLRAALDGPLGRLAGIPLPPGQIPGLTSPEEPAAPSDKIHSFLDFSSRILSSEKKPRREDLALDMELVAGPDRIAVTMPQLRFFSASLTGQAEYLPGDRPRLSATITAADLDLDRLPRPSGGPAWILPTAFLKNTDGHIRLDARNLTAGGAVLADAHATAAMRNGQIRLSPVSALTPGGTLSADLRGEVRGQALDLTAEAEIVDAAPKRNGTGGKNNGRALRSTTLVANGTMDAQGLTGNLSLTSPDPLAAARSLGLSREDGAAAQNPLDTTVKAAFVLVPGRERTWERLELKGLRARIGPGEIDGGLTVKNDPVPALNLDLRLAALDQDILAALSGIAGSSGDGRPEMPRLDLGGRIAVDKATVRGVEAKNLVVEGTASRDKVEAASISADMFGGKLSGRAEATLGDVARLSVNASLAGADAAALTGKLLNGPCAVRVTAEGQGETLPALITTLSGRVEAEMTGDPKSTGRKTEAPPFSRLKADIGFKGRPGRVENGSPDASRSYDVTSAMVMNGPGTLREVKADAQAVAAFDQDGVQLGQGKLSGTASLFLPGEKDGRNLPVSFAAAFTADPGEGAFAARNLTLEAAGTKGGGKIEKKGRDEGGKLSGSLDFPDLNPRDVLPALGLATPPHAAEGDLRHGRLSFQLAETAAGIELKGISLHLDDTQVTGTLLFRNGFGRPKIDLELTHLDCDRYFPPKKDEAKPKDAGQDDPLDLARMREYDVEARIRFGLLKKGNITWKHGQTDLAARSGVFSVRHEAADFYGGRFQAEVKGDARDVVLKTSLDLQIDGFDAATFLKEWAEGDVLASGGTTFVLAVKTNGLTERALRRNLSGSARFQVTRGALKIREPGSPPPSPQEPAAPATAPPPKAAEPKFDLLPFSVLSASYAAREGVAVTNDFLIDGKDMKVNGTGSVDLRDESIDLAVVATLDSGNKVPATVKGPLEDPKLEIDRNKLVGDMVYRVLKGIITLPAKALGKLLFIE